MNDIEAIIEHAFEQRDRMSPSSVNEGVREAVLHVIDGLDRGEYRVAEKRDDTWTVNEWLKKAVLLYFRISDNTVLRTDLTRFFDKVPMKYAHYSVDDFHRDGVRVVPPAMVRKGAFVDHDAVLMPSYINIGARVGKGTMIDTWATVGSCAQIGDHVHISGGAGIGGVLEPLQATPTIIEDHCFIGARSEVVEGVIVEEGSVIGMGVFLGQSTRIYDRDNDEIIYGRVPSGSVVVPGSLPATNGKYSLSCAVIVKKVDAKTRAKVGINSLLRAAEDEA